MKNLLFLLVAIALISISSKAQTTIAMDTSTYQGQSEQYCMIVGTEKFLSKKVRIEIDFGQESGFFDREFLVDPKTGRKMEFNSMIDALNYMNSKGWEFVNSYAITVSNQNVYHWLLSKPVKKK